MGVRDTRVYNTGKIEHRSHDTKYLVSRKPPHQEVGVKAGKAEVLLLAHAYEASIADKVVHSRRVSCIALRCTTRYLLNELYR